MSSVYETVRLSAMKFDEDEQAYTYLCPCGDLFTIYLEELHDGEDIAPCPSCTLKIKVIFDAEELPSLRDEDAAEAPEAPEGGEGTAPSAGGAAEATTA